MSCDFLKMTLSDSEYLAENNEINILPNFEMPAITLLCGTYGPFYPQQSIKVPLWLAIALKKQGRCRIQVPSYMHPENVKDICKKEKETPVDDPQRIPETFREESLLLLQHAGNDITNVDYVRQTLEDLENIRHHKLQANLRTLVLSKKQNLESLRVELVNPTTTEIHSLRPFITQGLLKLDSLYESQREIYAKVNPSSAYNTDFNDQPINYADLDVGAMQEATDAPLRKLRRGGR